eukprot:CAMPEP_0115054064 /NCGR_PEP_ID=MMETSP0227-20121206/3879_1 /TAXON_ID=89957 /ORGANISM="Polarella glacialis, Strain CCMP 1383" /LENGTH=40 /DNA_ID= /DNA_START= /DNA_END= /DNA_ORIENTATION=
MTSATTAPTRGGGAPPHCDTIEKCDVHHAVGFFVPSITVG